MLHKSFEFDATSYEIYENGRCIQRANCNTSITVRFASFDGMTFEMTNNPTYLIDFFSLPTSPEDLLEDRVQYGKLNPIDFASGNMSKPIICNIFPQKGILRFATPNPIRIIEFSGKIRLL